MKYLSIYLMCIILTAGYSKDVNNGKALYTAEEMKQRAMFPADPENLDLQYLKEKRNYETYLSSLTTAEEPAAPNWRPFMSPVDDQGKIPACGIYAACAAAEGQLQIANGSVIGSGIDLDEMELYDPSFPYSGLVKVVLNNIKSKKVSSEIGSYPNWRGAKWTILSYTDNIVDGRDRTPIQGIEMIKTVLEQGPVTAEFRLYNDFSRFFASNPKGVYRWDGKNRYLDVHHAVVIVSYYEDKQNPENSYWLCKNSWSTAFADDGYFRIGFGECGIETINNYIVTADKSCLPVLRGKNFAEKLNNYPDHNLTIENESNEDTNTFSKQTFQNTTDKSLSDDEIKEKNLILANNYPNPFNPVTKIKFKIKNDTHVILTVYNALGQRVVELINKPLSAGFHEAEFNGSNLASGTYIYRITTKESTQVKKMLLIK